MVNAVGGPNRIPPVQPPGVQAPGMQRPGQQPGQQPGAPRGQQTGVGMQTTNGTDTVNVTQQAIQANNTGEPATGRVQTVAVVGGPETPPPLTPERTNEEQANMRTQGLDIANQPPAARIPEMLQEFAPGQANGQNMDMFA